MRIKRNSSTLQSGNRLSDPDGVNVANFAEKYWSLREPKVILSMIDDDDYNEPKDKKTRQHIQDIATKLVQATSLAGPHNAILLLKFYWVDHGMDIWRKYIGET